MKHRSRGKGPAPHRKPRADLGTAPGSLVYVGERAPEKTTMCVIGYDPVGAWKRSAADIREVLAMRNPAGVSWINIDGLDNADALSQLAKAYNIHPLTMEDILNTRHRPKAEEFNDYLVIILKAITLGGEDGQSVEYEQISLVLTRDTVISFQERPGDTFDHIRKRLEDNQGRLRRMGPDYLAYALIDSIVDNYFLVLEEQGTKLEAIEDRATSRDSGAFLEDLQGIRREILHIRRNVWPLRDTLAYLNHLDSKLISAELDPFLKDLRDNVIQAAETIEQYRELVASATELNLSTMSARMNEVMKVLTIISTIFMPLTFIAGVYGMNFRHMPELAWKWAYPAVMGLMALVAGGMVVFFKRKKWF